MPRKRKAQRVLEEGERTLYGAFAGAAAELSGLYAQALERQRAAYARGAADARERVRAWAAEREACAGGDVRLADLLRFLGEDAGEGGDGAPGPSPVAAPCPAPLPQGMVPRPPPGSASAGGGAWAAAVSADPRGREAAAPEGGGAGRWAEGSGLGVGCGRGGLRPPEGPGPLPMSGLDLSGS